MLKPTPKGAMRMALAAALAALAGCIDNDPPSRARVVIEASPEVPLQLVVSTSFGTVTDPETGRREAVLIVADTTMISEGFDQEYGISSTLRIFVELRNTSDSPEDARMQVFLDEDIDYDVANQVGAGEFLRYMYTSRGFS